MLGWSCGDAFFTVHDGAFNFGCGATWNYWGTSTHGTANLSKPHECCCTHQIKVLHHETLCPHRAFFGAPGGQSLRPQLFELQLCAVGGAATARHDSGATRIAGPYRCGHSCKHICHICSSHFCGRSPTPTAHMPCAPPSMATAHARRLFAASHMCMVLD